MRANPRLARGTSIFVALLLVWIVLDGTGDVWVGVVAAALGAGLGVWVAPPASVTVRFWGGVAFAGYFVAESFRGAADVAWRALRRDLPIDPHLVRYDVTLPPGPARTLLAGVVSLLPGTLTADVDGDGATLTVHAITPHPEGALRALEARIGAWLGPAEGAP